MNCLRFRIMSSFALAVIMAVVALILNLNYVSGQGTTQFFAAISGTNEVLQSLESSIGDAQFMLDGRNLSYFVEEYWGGTPVSAGVYGPAPPGSNGPFLFDLGDFFEQEADPPCLPSALTWNGVLNLSPEQVTNLQSGLLYVNITSSNYPDGEGRGQILSAVAPVIVTNEIFGVGEPGGNFVIPADPGATFGFYVNAWGTDLAFQWMLNGHPIIGATGSCYGSSDAGAIYAIVSNSLGSVTSAVSYVSVSTMFGPPVTVTPHLNPPNAGTVGGAGYFYHATVVTLNETTTNAWYHFDSWSQGGKVIGTNSYAVITVSKNESVEANFALNSYDVSTTVFPTNAGTIAGDGIRKAGTRTTLTASDKAGFLFSNWTENGQVVSTQPAYTFVVTNNMALTANFVPNPVQATTQFFAALSGTNEVQQTLDSSIGDASFTLSGSNLSFYVEELWGGPPVSAGIYGPAGLGSDGPFLFDLGGFFEEEAQPPCFYGAAAWNGVLNLNPEQITDLQSGLLYVNITSSNYPAGEWRGQILSAVAPTIVTNHIFGVMEPGGNFLTSPLLGGVFGFFIYAWGTDLSYQWVLNGSPIVGDGGPCFEPDQVSEAGAIYAIVSNSLGSVTSVVSYVSVTTGFGSPVTMTARLIPPNAGTVSGSGSFPYSTAVTLNATATNVWYHFDSWSQGGKVIGTNSYVVIMASKNESVTANFALNSYNVSTTAFPTNAGTTTGEGVRKAGTRTTVIARAKAGFLFSNWMANGQVVGSQAAYTFVVTNDTALTANFVSNLFLTATGVYNGLFFDPTNASENSAGKLGWLVVGSQGAASGRLWVSGTSYLLGGRFDVSGFWRNRIARPMTRGGPLTLEMNLDWNQSPPVITGLVTGTNGGPWTNALYAERAGDKSARGQYTMLIPPGIGAPSNCPPGDGYALINDQAGEVIINGKLADGTAFSLAAAESDNGDMPLYARLYASSGLLLGWLNFASGSPAGNLAWVRPASRTGLYTNGFTNYIAVQGSGWTNSGPLHAGIAMTNGQMEISGGPLETPLEFNVAVAKNNTLVILPASPATKTLTGTINGKTGLLTVTFGDGERKATITGYGVVLQNQTNAAGFFVTKTNAGAISLQQP
jgi:hypothetical protein